MSKAEQVERAAKVIWDDRYARQCGTWEHQKRDRVMVVQTLATARAAISAALEGEAVPVADLGDKATALERSLEQEEGGVSAYLRDDIQAAIDAMRAHPSSNADRLEGVKVKALEWVLSLPSVQHAWAPFGAFYSVEQAGGGWVLTKHESSGKTKSFWDDEEQAKAAAQADFDQRVRSCLTSPDTHEDDKRVGEARNEALREAAKVALHLRSNTGVYIDRNEASAAILALVKPQGDSK